MKLFTYLHPRQVQQFKRNAHALRGTRYEPYFLPDLLLPEEGWRAMQQGPIPHEAVPELKPHTLNALLKAGELPYETGYGASPTGWAYAASRTRFPGCTPAMFTWWFGWHAGDPLRYKLWHPYCHESVSSRSPWKLTQPGLSDLERYLGTVHDVTEFIGPSRQNIQIHFRHPVDLGFDAVKFMASNVVAHACGEVCLQRPRLQICTMIHLCRPTPDGFELRSRYFLGHALRLGPMNLSPLLRSTGVSRHLLNEELAFEQMLHDQLEFTHLARILPNLYAQFGPGSTSNG